MSGKKAAPKPPDVAMAASISVYVCRHRSVHVRLHGKDGKIFAAGILPAPAAVNMVDDILSGLEEGGSPCQEGHA